MNRPSLPQMLRMTPLPAVVCVRETEDGVDVVVSIEGRVSFLVRGKTGDHPDGQCPFLRYKVRRIADDVPRQERQSCATPRFERSPNGARLLEGSPA
jgi:hypothetical protein